MKKTINYSIILSVVFFLSCQEHSQRVKEKNSINVTIPSHLGAWEMIYFQSIHETDTSELVGNGNPLAITLMTPSHFSYQWRRLIESYSSNVRN